MANRNRSNQKDRGIDILIKLVQDGPQTLNQLGVSRFRMMALVEDEAVTVASTQKHMVDGEDGQVAGRGRPANIFKPTKKGADRAKRRIAKAEKEAAATS